MEIQEGEIGKGRFRVQEPLTGRINGGSKMDGCGEEGERLKRLLHS